LTALTQEQVQVVAQDGIDAADSPVLDTLPGVQARYTPGNAWEHLTFNLDNPVLADPSVRQAIAFGLNRPALNEAILFSKGEVAVSQVPSWSWAYDPTMAHYDYNALQAEQLLDRAGWSRSGPDGIRAKSGQRLSLKYWSTPASFRPGLMAMVKDQLAQIGVELNIDSFPSGTLFDLTGASPQALVTRQFDIVEFAWVDTYDPGADALYNMHSSNIPAKANGYRGGNYSGYKNPRSDQLLDQLQRSLDPSFRRIALQEAQTIWQSDLPVLPLLLRPITTAASTRLVNFRPTPATAGETWNIEQWDLLAPPS
jgi:peptide/nickel transport system substrate-binding protein